MSGGNAATDIRHTDGFRVAPGPVPRAALVDPAEGEDLAAEKSATEPEPGPFGQA
ncbi:hypothetical protein ABZ863_22540 [Saccharomonospora sp. NPDC046836]|uniref:hypothetical protein n=1 Tax=Saccharomonospora sp. NPDC046836 TaxID=3156921 RepID=UPI0033FF21EC